MTKKLTKVVCYGRVSTKSSSQLESLEHQEQYFRKKLTKNNGYDLVDVYIDKGLTGTDFKNRDEFNRMIKDAGVDIKIDSAELGEKRNRYIKANYFPTTRKPKYEMIYVKNSSRFARNLEVIGIIRALKQQGVNIFFEDIGKSTKNDGDELVINILLMMDERESKDKSTKVKFGAKATAENGKIRVGRELYGYDFNKEENTLRIINDEADVVRLCYKLRLENKGCRQIANELRDRNIKTRKGVEFRPNVLSRMLQNPIYTGKVVRNKWSCTHTFGNNSTVLRDKSEWIVQDSDRVDKIISDEDFDKVQELISNASTSKKGVYKGTKEFSGRIVCEKCGKYYVRNSDKLADGTKKIFYNCSTKKQHGVKACDSRNIKDTEIEKLIELFIQDGKYKKTVKNFIELIIKEQSKENPTLYIDKDEQARIEKINEQINNYKVMLSKLTDVFLMDNSDTAKETFMIKKQEVDVKVKELEDELKKLTATEEERKLKDDKLQKLKDDLYKSQEKVPNQISREKFIRDYLSYFIVKKNGELQIMTKMHVTFILALKIIDGSIKDFLEEVDK